MALIFECIQTDGIAQPSYLVGDDAAGVAAVIDPRADVDGYLALARTRQVSIAHIFETHIHADLVSGARELGARVESAKIFVSHEGGARNCSMCDRRMNGRVVTSRMPAMSFWENYPSASANWT